MLSTLAVGGGTSGACVAGVNVKGEYRLWSPGSQQQCFGTQPSVMGTYKYITLYMMILFII